MSKSLPSSATTIPCRRWSSGLISLSTVSHEGLTREEHDQQMIAQIDQYKPDYVVLAKYMRVLTPAFVQHYPNQVINIHHSFLPAFIGARPYHQAYERGVKIIGATAHYVNDNLMKARLSCRTLFMSTIHTQQMT